MLAASVCREFLKPIEHALILARMLRTAADVGERQRPQQVGNGALAVDHTKTLFDHARKIDPSPTGSAIAA